MILISSSEGAMLMFALMTGSNARKTCQMNGEYYSIRAVVFTFNLGDQHHIENTLALNM